MKRFLTVLFVSCFLFIFAAGSLDANSIPRLQGRWDLNGTASIAGERGTIKGSASVTSYIADDGYEVVTELLRQGDVYDLSGRWINSFRGITTEDFKITSNSFTIIVDGDSSEVVIESSTRVKEKIRSYEQGYYAEINFVYTRGEADSSGGGCSAGTSSPFAFLIILPLLVLAFKKCR